MKKILFMTGFYKNRGGAISMLTLIRDLQLHGYDVKLVTTAHGDAEEFEKDYNVHAHYIKSYNWIIPINRRRNIKVLFKSYIKRILNLISEQKLYQFIKAYNPDIVIINSSDQYVGIKSCNKLKIPVIMYFREFMTLDHGTCYWSEKMADKYFSRLNGGIAISNEIKNYFSKYPIKNLKVIYNGIDMKKYEVSGEKRDTSFFNISCIGNLCKGKNQLLVVKAILLLLEKGIDNFHLYLYGEDSNDYAQSLKNYVAEKSIKNYVTFAGSVNNLNDMYGKTHINVLCSQNEAFGRVIVEGMVNHCLTIVPNSGGAKEIIKDKYNGFLFEKDNEQMLCDVLNYAITNYDKLTPIIEQGYQDAKLKYTSEKNLENVENYMKEICEKV